MLEADLLIARIPQGAKLLKSAMFFPLSMPHELHDNLLDSAPYHFVNGVKIRIKGLSSITITVDLQSLYISLLPWLKPPKPVAEPWLSAVMKEAH
jgi:hypothetical protein